MHLHVDARYQEVHELGVQLTAFPASLPQVSRILYSFATAFRRSAKKAPLSAPLAPPLTPDSDLFTFNVSLEIKEDDGKGTFRWEGRRSAHRVAVRPERFHPAQTFHMLLASTQTVHVRVHEVGDSSFQTPTDKIRHFGGNDASDSLAFR